MKLGRILLDKKKVNRHPSGFQQRSWSSWDDDLIYSGWFPRILACAEINSSLQSLEPQPLRLRALGAHAALLVFLVLAVVALEILHVRIAFEGQDVSGDA